MFRKRGLPAGPCFGLFGKSVLGQGGSIIQIHSFRTYGFFIVYSAILLADINGDCKFGLVKQCLPARYGLGAGLGGVSDGVIGRMMGVEPCCVSPRTTTVGETPFHFLMISI